MFDQIPRVTLYTVAMGLSVTTFTLYCYSLYAEFKASQTRDEMAEEWQGSGSFVFAILKPLARFSGHLVSSALNRLRDRYGEEGVLRHVGRARLKLQRSLTTAGNPEGLTGDLMLGLWCVSLLGWSGAGIMGTLATGMSFFVLCGVILGLVHPYLWLRGKMKARQQEVRRLLPYALDLLTLSVEAGLDFTAALERMLPKLGDSALADEFGESLRKIRLGRSRAEALREMADRLKMPEITMLCNSLLQADELGSDLGPVLRMLSDQTREERSNRAEKKAMEAPVKILFPLIAFIFPTVFIILFAPVGIRYLNDMFGF
ncbi:MAG: type II secretion system F family protein [Planctomycetota bacterium]